MRKITDEERQSAREVASRIINNLAFEVPVDIAWLGLMIAAKNIEIGANGSGLLEGRDQYKQYVDGITETIELIQPPESVNEMIKIMREHFGQKENDAKSAN